MLPVVDAGPLLTDRDLAAIARLVYEKSGITLHSGKRALVAARLQKRLRVRGLDSFHDYLEYVGRDHSGDELVALLDAIATNHTSFFREPQHFDLLRSRIFAASDATRRISIWSAACSTGEEPYTIAMTALDTFGESARHRVRVLASDLSTKALAAARSAVYRMDRVEQLPVSVLKAHFERGLGAQAGVARVLPPVRNLVEFRQVNLLDTHAVDERFDVIFCRNVMIYFDTAIQQRVVATLERHLAPGGHLFISHSESLNAVKHGLQWVAPAVYQRGRS